MSLHVLECNARGDGLPVLVVLEQVLTARPCPDSDAKSEAHVQLRFAVPVIMLDTVDKERAVSGFTMCLDETYEEFTARVAELLRKDNANSDSPSNDPHDVENPT